MKAMIFAAGLGTRLKDETSNKPKALVEIGGKTLLQRAIEKLKKEGITEIVINAHHFSEQVIEFVGRNDFGIPIHLSDESGKLLDTGGGLKKARHLLKGDLPIIIYNVDIISDIDLQTVIKEHIKSKAIATVVVRNRNTQRYLKFDNEKRLVGWINKKTGESKISVPENFENSVELAFSGIHIIQPEIFDFMPPKDRFSIIVLYLELAKKHLIKGYCDQSELWIDVGKPMQLQEARQLFG